MGHTGAKILGCWYETFVDILLEWKSRSYNLLSFLISVLEIFLQSICCRHLAAACSNSYSLRPVAWPRMQI